MMTQMRGMVPLIMWVVIIAFVGLMFFGWGMDFASGGGRRQIVGRIAGKDISLQSFERLVSMERERQRQNADAENAESQERFMPRRVWDEQVTNMLMDMTFRSMRLEATGDEMFEYLKSNPPPGVDTASFFQTDGKFDTAKYVAWLNNPASYDNPGMRQIEQYLQNLVIPGRKLELLLGAGVTPSRAEVAREYRAEKERAIVEYAAVNAMRFPVDSSEYSSAKIAAYYEAHQDSFTSAEPQMDLYFISVPKIATANDEVLLRNELIELRDRIESNDISFEEAAKAESEDPGSAQRGGDLGWFGRGAMVREFDSVAFTIAPKKISDPIKTQFGYHLLMVEATRTSADGKREVHARHILRKVAPSLETLDSIKEYLDSLRIKGDEAGLGAVARANPGLRYDSTGLFKRGDYVPKIGYVSGLVRFAVDNNEGDICESVLENKDAFYLLQIKRKLRKGVLPLADVRDRAAAALRRDYQKEKARTLLQSLVGALGANDSLALLSRKDSMVTSGVTDTVTRTSFVPALGFGGSALSVAFSLKTGVRSGIVETGDGFCVVRPLWKQMVDSIPWNDPQVTGIEQRLANEQRQRVYQSWLAAARRDAKVVSNVDKYYSE